MTIINDNRIIAGCRIEAWDSFSESMRPATVVCRYGTWSALNKEYKYPDLVDIKFDHDEQISHGHFTARIKVIDIQWIKGEG